MKDKVLAYLKAEGDYKSGEEISQQLGVTRSAVWKAIKKLQAEGYEIASSTKKGYKLILTPDLVTSAEIKSVLQTKHFGTDIHYFDTIDSTNNVAKQLGRDGAAQGTLVIAEKQEGGKGRLGRRWTSPAKTGIWMSLILRPEIRPQDASQITLVAGLGMCEAIEKVTGLPAKIKWPNDIVVNGKKVCGILTEMSAQVEAIDYIVVGIGVNVNMESFPEDLPYASSLAIEGKKTYARKDIVAKFLEIFEKDYACYAKEPTLKPFLQRYTSTCITLHKKVKIIDKGEEMIAMATDINEEGAIIITLEDGTTKAIACGEVSVRGLYGYV